MNRALSEKHDFSMPRSEILTNNFHYRKIDARLRRQGQRDIRLKLTRALLCYASVAAAAHSNAKTNSWYFCYAFPEAAFHAIWIAGSFLLSASRVRGSSRFPQALQAD